MSDPNKPASAEELPDDADDDRTAPAELHEELTVPGPRDVVVYDPLAAYRREVGRFPTLTAEEERELAIRYLEHGDRDAAYRLVTSHLRLVVKIAFDFKRSWQNLLDLIQEGNVGLLLAVQKFDPYRGIRLSTYASWWIRAYVIKFLLDNWRLVKVGTTNARRKLLFNLRKEKEALIAQGIEPGTKLLADRLNVSEEDVIDVDRSLGQPDVSIETPVAADSDRLLRDTLAASDEPIDEEVANRQQREIINDKLEAFAESLPERERIVFRERLLAEEPATLQSLGDRFGMTREGLRQVEKRLLRALKAYLTAELEGVTDLVVGHAEDAPGSTAPVEARPKRAKPAAEKTTKKAAKRPAKKAAKRPTKKTTARAKASEKKVKRATKRGRAR